MTKNPKLLTAKELKKVETKFPEWKLDAKNTKLTQVFEFEKHIDALIFIARTTVNAEILKHYPDVTFTHLKVKMVLTTHEAKGLTKLDIKLLERIEKVRVGQQGVDKK